MKSFIDDCRPRMQSLVAKPSDVWSLLPNWRAGGSPNEKLHNHIANLRIPTVTGGRPSLLLHNLGEGEGEDERLQHVFRFNTHVYVN